VVVSTTWDTERARLRKLHHLFRYIQDLHGCLDQGAPYGPAWPGQVRPGSKGANGLVCFPAFLGPRPSLSCVCLHVPTMGQGPTNLTTQRRLCLFIWQLSAPAVWSCMLLCHQHNNIHQHYIRRARQPMACFVANKNEIDKLSTNSRTQA
jgi:hypothetical protein